MARNKEREREGLESWYLFNVAPMAYTEPHLLKVLPFLNSTTGWRPNLRFVAFQGAFNI